MLKVKGFPYQCSTTKKNHEDNEGFKPVVFNNCVAGFPECPPNLAIIFIDVHSANWKPFYTSYYKRLNKKIFLAS